MRKFASLLCVLAVSTISLADESAAEKALEKFRNLKGDWAGTVKMHDGNTRDVKISYNVTAGGSTVIETIFAGTPMEMTTMIHEHQGDLVLTHYCMLQNQPRMKASVNGNPNTIAFKFLDGTNMDSASDMHMHEAIFKFVGKDEIETRWMLYDKGKPVGQTVMKIKRQ